ncbi:MAG: family peptidase, partial [Caulobacteraceae bacterium]|nr:family peptidase [Caulobacteraceae bacterium]
MSFGLRPATLRAAIFLAILALAPAVSAAQTAPSLHSYSAPVMSPDGRTVALIESGTRGIVLRATADGAVQNQFDPCAGCAYGAPVWSPDGKALAFLATSPGVSTLYDAAIDTADPTTVIKITG